MDQGLPNGLKLNTPSKTRDIHQGKLTEKGRNTPQLLANRKPDLKTCQCMILKLNGIIPNTRSCSPLGPTHPSLVSGTRVIPLNPSEHTSSVQYTVKRLIQACNIWAHPTGCKPSGHNPSTTYLALKEQLVKVQLSRPCQHNKQVTHWE